MKRRNAPGSSILAASSLIWFEGWIACSSVKTDTAVCRRCEKADGRLKMSTILHLTERQCQPGILFSCFLNEGDDEKTYRSLPVSDFHEDSAWIPKVSRDKNHRPAPRTCAGRKCSLCYNHSPSPNWTRIINRLLPNRPPRPGAQRLSLGRSYPKVVLDLYKREHGAKY